MFIEIKLTNDRGEIKAHTKYCILNHTHAHQRTIEAVNCKKEKLTGKVPRLWSINTASASHIHKQTRLSARRHHRETETDQATNRPRSFASNSCKSSHQRGQSQHHTTIITTNTSHKGGVYLWRKKEAPTTKINPATYLQHNQGFHSEIETFTQTYGRVLTCIP